MFETFFHATVEFSHKLWSALVSWKEGLSTVGLQGIELPVFVLLGALAIYFGRYIMVPSLIRRVSRLFPKHNNRAIIIETYRIPHVFLDVILLMVLDVLASKIFNEIPFLLPILHTLVLVAILRLMLRSLDAALEVYDLNPNAARRPITHYIQALRILAYAAVAIAFVGVVLGLSPTLILGSLGATSAVLLVVFQDAILGLVSGVALLRNRLIQKGDWIEMPQYGVDGAVAEVSLFSLKVENWDGVLISVPMSQMLKQSFKSYAGVVKKNRRRMCRSFFVDVHSVHELTEAEIAALKEDIPSLKNYLNQQEQQAIIMDKRVSVSNLSAFRAYLESYLNNHTMVDQDRLILVRHRDLNERGALPVEAVSFIKAASAGTFDPIQSEIFEHIYAMAPAFHLRFFPCELPAEGAQRD